MLSWNFLIVAILPMSGLVVVFNTEWLIAHVTNWLAYIGAMIVGIAAVMLTDYLSLRRQVVLPGYLFVKDHQGVCWFWGGVKLVVMVIVVLVVVYLMLFDLLTLKVGPTFRYVGATMPTLVICVLAYYLLMRLVIATCYRNFRQSAEKKVREGLLARPLSAAKTKAFI